MFDLLINHFRTNSSHLFDRLRTYIDSFLSIFFRGDDFPKMNTR